MLLLRQLRMRPALLLYHAEHPPLITAYTMQAL